MQEPYGFQIDHVQYSQHQTSLVIFEIASPISNFLGRHKSISVAESRIFIACEVEIGL